MAQSFYLLDTVLHMCKITFKKSKDSGEQIQLFFLFVTASCSVTDLGCDRSPSLQLQNPLICKKRQIYEIPLHIQPSHVAYSHWTMAPFDP